MNVQHSQFSLRRFNSRFLRSAISIGLMIVFVSTHVIACDFCVRLPNVPVEFGHPGAIEVAMATQAEAKSGQINLDPWITIETMGNAHRKLQLSKLSSRKLVASWTGTRPAKENVSVRCTLEIIFVDVDESCWLDIRAGEILAGDPRNGPAEVRLITTRAGFCELLQSGLASCEARQLVQIESTGTVDSTQALALFPGHAKVVASVVGTPVSGDSVAQRSEVSFE